MSVVPRARPKNCLTALLAAASHWHFSTHFNWRPMQVSHLPLPSTFTKWQHCWRNRESPYLGCHIAWVF
mgnify:CR=1 FL=1